MYIENLIEQQKTQLVIFDLDGTLVDSVPEIAAAVDDALLALNLPQAGVEHVREWVGNGLSKLWERALQYADVYTPEFHQQSYQDLLMHYERNVNQSTCAYAGVTELLTVLQQHGITMAVCTNKMERFVPGILQKQNIDGFFSMIVGGDTFAEKKPSALPLLKICQRFNVAVENTLMIGDSESDAKAAQAAGIACVLLAQGYSQGIDLNTLPALAIKTDIQSLLM